MLAAAAVAVAAAQSNSGLSMINYYIVHTLLSFTLQVFAFVRAARVLFHCVSERAGKGLSTWGVSRAETRLARFFLNAIP